MASIDSGFPKKMWVTPSGYEGLRICDSIRDRFGNFWVVGHYRIVANGNYIPIIWKFSSSYALINSYEVDGIAFDKSKYVGCTSIAIDGNDSIHIVGIFTNEYNNKRIFYTKKLIISPSFDSCIELITENQNYTHAIYPPPGPTITLNADGDLVVVSEAQGYDPGYENFYRVISKAYANGAWGSVAYIDLSIGHMIGPHVTACRKNTLTHAYKLWVEREGTANEIALYRVSLSGNNVTYIQEDSVVGRCETNQGIRLIFDGINYYANMVGNSDSSHAPIYRARYRREDGIYYTWPDDPGEQRMRGLAFNELEEKFLAIYERKSNSSMYARRKENLSAVEPGTWYSELQLTTAMTFTSTCGLCRAYPIVTAKLFGVPTHGFGFVVTSDSALLGDGETQPAIYFYALDSLTWLSPDAELSLDSVTPHKGVTDGGVIVTLGGTEFLDGITVTFDGLSATKITVVSSTEMTCKTPAHAAGAVDVVATNPNSGTSTLTKGYLYLVGFPSTPVPQYVHTERALFRTLITQPDSGAKSSRAKWDEEVMSFRLEYGALTEDDIETLWDYYIAKTGRMDVFAYKSWLNDLGYMVRFRDKTMDREKFAYSVLGTGFWLVEVPYG